MKAILAAGCCVFLLCTAQPAAATANATPAPTPAAQADALRATLKTVFLDARGEKPDRATLTTSLKAILADPAYGALTKAERHGAQLLYGALLFDAGNYQDADAPIREATRMSGASDFDWGLRLRNSYLRRDYADTSVATIMLAQRWPAKLAEFGDSPIFNIAEKAQALGDGAFAADLLNALYVAKWRPSSPFATADSLWLALVRIRLESGDGDGARQVALEIRDPVSLLEMHADKRFDAIVQSDPGHFNVMKAFAAALEEMKAKATAAPDKLEGVNAIATLLLRMRRPKEALAQMDDALARIAAKANTYSDVEDNIGWLKDQRADALFAAGNDGDAIATMEAGVAFKEHGGVNVSQAINLAEVYTLYDRPKDALAAVAGLQFSNASEYGRLALEDARACAYFQLGDGASLAPIVEYMKAHARDGAQPFLNTMLCTGDLDGAAAEVVAQLNDPVRRMWILYYLQDYAPDPHANARQAAIHAAWMAVRNRPDVAAAIARVGRIESYNLKNPAY